MDQEFREKVIEGLASLKADMQTLVGPDGRISKIESRLSRAERLLWGGYGAALLLGVLMKVGTFGLMK